MIETVNRGDCDRSPATSRPAAVAGALPDHLHREQGDVRDARSRARPPPPRDPERRPGADRGPRAAAHTTPTRQRCSMGPRGATAVQRS